MKKFFLMIAGVICLQSAWANDTPIVQHEIETESQLKKIEQTQITPTTPQISTETFSSQNQEVNGQTEQNIPKDITLEDIENNPKLVQLLLNQALQTRNYGAVERLLPIYQKWEERDPILVDFAQGALWRVQGKHKKAISLYKNILKKNPEFLTVRLDLAVMMLENQQIKDAQNQFNQAKKQGLPDDVLPRVQEYEKVIARTKKWDISGGLSYTRDNNINNMASTKEIRLPQFGNMAFEKDSDFLPKKGRGLSYNFNIERDVNLGENHYLNIGAGIDGVNYWNNHDFDDVTAQIQLGYRHKNVNGDWSAIPFFEKRLYGGESYYNRSGINTAINRWINNKWRVNANGTLAWKKYASKRNGRDSQISAGATYMLGQKTYLFGGLNYGRDKLHLSPLNSSKRLGFYVGWGQSWGKQFASRISINRYNEKYDGNHYVFTDKRRHDRVLSTNITLWNSKVSIWGVTPRLNWRYTKVKSNISELHSYNKQKWFIDFEKTF